MGAGCRHLCYASEVTGGDIRHGRPNYGLNLLLIRIDDPATPTDAIQDYLAESGIGIRQRVKGEPEVTGAYALGFTIAWAARSLFRSCRACIRWVCKPAK
jgi:hypothetical protein